MPWHISRTGNSVDLPEYEAEYDCRHVGMLCAERNCEEFQQFGSFPTESIWNKDGELKPELHDLSGWEHHHANGKQEKLLCVNDNFFRVHAQMTGLIIRDGSLDMARIDPSPNEGPFSVHKLSIAESKQKRCKYAENACDQHLQSCVEFENGKVQYPFFEIGKEHQESFSLLDTCDDKGRVDGRLCSKVVCSPRGGTDSNGGQIHWTQGLPAIVECEGYYYAHLIYHHKDGSKWCLSKYHNQGENPTDINFQSLEGELQRQNVSKDRIETEFRDKIYDPKVQSFWFWGDAVDALQNRDIVPRKAYEAIGELGLLEFGQKFEHFTDGTKWLLAPLRGCPKNNLVACNEYQVTPWDVLQTVFNQRMAWVEREQNYTTPEKEIGGRHASPNIGHASVSKDPLMKEKEEEVKEEEAEKATEEAEEKKEADETRKEVLEEKKKEEQEVADAAKAVTGDTPTKDDGNQPPVGEQGGEPEGGNTRRRMMENSDISSANDKQMTFITLLVMLFSSVMIVAGFYMFLGP